jgi:hypothetical protein
VDEARDNLREALEVEIAPAFEGTTTGFTEKPGTMRLDVSTLHKGGSLRAEYSLNASTGLVCLGLEKIKRPFEEVERRDFRI